jgi:hypothetical protein
MSGGLFGNIAVSNKITLKPSEPASTIQRLMMEQDVFKSFVSGHPLD